ncbi:hypothetical protein N0V85_005762 [Neurospora sp. IMI 360204]|nr:hypothetical protein N0V85_005762 [Neurospora sp. IMI 360204]
MFYTERTIARTVTLDFLVSHLTPQHHSRANDYWKSIKLRARRIFLILLDLGVPSLVFSFLDEGWDDLQLPFSRERLAEVPLTGVFGARDEHLEKKFYERQWRYLPRDIKDGDCVEFGEEEVVPVEVASGSGGPDGHGIGIRKSSIQHVQQVVTGHAAGFGLGQGGSAGEKPMAVEDRVAVSDQPPGMVFTRRRIPLIGSKEQQSGGQGGAAGYAPMMTREDFLREIVAIKTLNLQNEHLARYFASYTHRGNGYMLFTPATTEHTFKSILSSGNLPASVKHLEKGQQRRLVMNWIHCLVDTVCWLHTSGSTSSDEGSEHGEGGKKNVLEGVGMMVNVIEGMLHLDPIQRKTALEVQGGTYLALREGCGIEEPHCVHEYGPSPLGRLTTKTPSPTRTPKQTTPTPSMYGGRVRSNSAVSTTSASASASASNPVLGPGSRSFSISGSAIWPTKTKKNKQPSQWTQTVTFRAIVHVGGDVTVTYEAQDRGSHCQFRFYYY